MRIIRLPRLPFTTRWVLANTWSIVAALAAHSVAGQLAGLDESTAAGAAISTLVSIAAGAPIIGGIVGFAQGRVLRRAFPALRVSRWVFRTMVGAALVLLLGGVSSRFGVVASFESFEGESFWSTAQRFMPEMLWPIAIGFAIGVLFSAPQIWGLPQLRRLWVEWLFANAAGWAVGMLITMVVLGLSPPENLRVVLAGLLTALVGTGAAVGLFTALVLRRLNHI